MIYLLYGFILGIFSILNPCTFIIIPVISAQAHKLKNIVAFLLGLTITFTVLGIIAALTGRLITNFFGFYVYLFAGAITLLAGFDMLNLIKIKSPVLDYKKPRSSFIFGLLFGWCALACLAPLLAAILVFIIAEASIIKGFMIMLFFSLGFIIPFLLFGLIITDKKIAKRLLRHSTTLKKAGGIILILASIYLFYIASGGLI